MFLPEVPKFDELYERKENDEQKNKTRSHYSIDNVD